MQRSTILKILAIAGVGVAGYYCYKKLSDDSIKRQPLQQPTSVRLGAVNKEYFAKLAQINAAKYEQAQKKLEQLANDNMNLHQKLAKQFKLDLASLSQQPVMVGMQQFQQLGHYQSAGSVPSSQIAQKIEDLDNIGNAPEPYDGVGPGVRKLNIDD